MNTEIFKRGFTLIELLVVIAIIGVLSSVVLASLNSAREKSRDSRKIADLKQISTALEFYRDSSGGLFPAESASNCNNPANNCLPEVGSDLIWDKFMSARPRDGQGNDYTYSNDAPADTKYCLQASQFEARSGWFVCNSLGCQTRLDFTDTKCLTFGEEK